LHVVGVAAEAGVAPAGIDGIGARFAQAAKGGDVKVFDLVKREKLRKIFDIEMRHAAGAGHGADVDEDLDVVLAQDGEEFVDGARGMAEGVEDRR